MICNEYLLDIKVLLMLKLSYEYLSVVTRFTNMIQDQKILYWVKFQDTNSDI